MPSEALLRLLLALILAGLQPALLEFEVSAYTAECSAGRPWYGYMANGDMVPEAPGVCALPVEYPFGTMVFLDGGEDGGSGLGTVEKVRCTDRGSAIVRLPGGVDRLDLFVPGAGGPGGRAEAEATARAWGRRCRWGIVLQPTQAEAFRAWMAWWWLAKLEGMVTPSAGGIDVARAQ